MEKLNIKAVCPREPKGSQNEPRGAKLEQMDFITGRWGSEKLKIKSVWPRELKGTKMSTEEPNWSKRILLQAAGALKSSK